LRTDPLTAIGRHWADGPALLDGAGVHPWGGIAQIYEINRADTVLNFRPHYGFSQYLDAVRSHRNTL
jgi:hypothetical protein